jgi:hypothetical protein
MNEISGQKPGHQKTPPHFSLLPAQLSPNCAINKETKAATINRSQVLQKNVVLVRVFDSLHFHHLVPTNLTDLPTTPE